ncbi:MAG TPA: pyridoxamine 5'-phosphate oxidase family protein [Streptosporangiaceae bacterium]|nr:pyridoxamine 5'-phosphate oxidase family protein [Streptosporangiaceae bacterium]
MGILTESMKRRVDKQRLGFCATVCADGSPNLAPKGTARVWDDDHLFFARKGYRFKGQAVVSDPGSADFAKGIERIKAHGSSLIGRVKAIVVIEVQRADPLISPAYDDGTATGADIVESQRERFARLHERRAQVCPPQRN